MNRLTPPPNLLWAGLDVVNRGVAVGRFPIGNSGFLMGSGSVIANVNSMVTFFTLDNCRFAT